MTTTILVHNAHRKVTVRTSDRVWDNEKGEPTNKWTEPSSVVVEPGQLYSTYCTDTRKIEIVEE